MDLEGLTAGFKNFKDVDNYEEISANAQNIKKRIDEATEYAKMINNRE